MRLTTSARVPIPGASSPSARRRVTASGRRERKTVFPSPRQPWQIPLKSVITFCRSYPNKWPLLNLDPSQLLAKPKSHSYGVAAPAPYGGPGYGYGPEPYADTVIVNPVTGRWCRTEPTGYRWCWTP
jgi:hypothetical protein